MSLRIRIRLPLRGPAPNTPTTDTVKRQGPAEQPGTIAPELLPDREANVNRSRKAGHTGESRIARRADRSEGSLGPAGPPPRTDANSPTLPNPCPHGPAHPGAAMRNPERPGKILWSEPTRSVYQRIWGTH